ncbi:carbonic anhydrase family protein [Nocardioides sp. KC13]|uniref:Carbonic anhydrase n=1 Tax=Nocardioides turkmenicus TaxID=2711220 RepID=A0A6M1RG07_9ACTN|nr:carbonic anhydrase family protein [Nocardioides sp. KC13]NGN95197.1 carbonic anhydrase family protein [Nocardioides sp. KC13]
MLRTSHSLHRRALLQGAAVVAGLTALSSSAGASATSTTSAGGPGSRQSPIRIRPSTTEPAHLPTLHVHYPHDATVTMTYVREDADEPDGCTVRGDEETVRAELPPGVGSLTVAGVTYGLRQFHWHTPSEHLVVAREYPIEMHFVHQDSSGHTLVVGVWVTPGPTNRTLGHLYDHLVSECTADDPVGHIDVGALLPRRHTSYRYDGSLTTAPYTEGVQWVMLTDPITASPRQIDRFRAMFPTGNRRDVQDLNGRVVRTDRGPF